MRVCSPPPVLVLLFILLTVNLSNNKNCLVRVLPLDNRVPRPIQAILIPRQDVLLSTVGPFHDPGLYAA